MSKYEVVYREQVTRSVIVEAHSHLEAANTVMYNANFDLSKSKVILDPNHREFVTARKIS